MTGLLTRRHRVALLAVLVTLGTVGVALAAPQNGGNPSVTLDVSPSDGQNLPSPATITVNGVGFGGSISGDIRQCTRDVATQFDICSSSLGRFTSSAGGTFSVNVQVTSTFTGSNAVGQPVQVNCLQVACNVRAESDDGLFFSQHSISFSSPSTTTTTTPSTTTTTTVISTTTTTVPSTTTTTLPSTTTTTLPATTTTTVGSTTTTVPPTTTTTTTPPTTTTTLPSTTTTVPPTTTTVPPTTTTTLPPTTTTTLPPTTTTTQPPTTTTVPPTTTTTVGSTTTTTSPPTTTTTPPPTTTTTVVPPTNDVCALILAAQRQFNATIDALGAAIPALRPVLEVFKEIGAGVFRQALAAFGCGGASAPGGAQTLLDDLLGAFLTGGAVPSIPQTADVAQLLNPGSTTESGGSEYVVQPGDSLWSIAEQLYGDADAYHTLVELNADLLEDEDVIRPGQVLRT